MFSNLTQRFKKPTHHNVFSQIDIDNESPFITLTDTTPAPIESAFRPHYEQRGDLAGFFSALREAAERFDMTHIAPLVALDPTVRFQLRTVTVKTTPDNELMLRELETLQQHIIKTAARNCIKPSQSAKNFDLSSFYGVIIIPGDEAAAGEAVLTLATVGIERINLIFGFEGEHISVAQDERSADEAIPVSASVIQLRLRHPDGRTEKLVAEYFPLVIGKSPSADISVGGEYVSREHATLFYDTDLRRVVLQDHSRHGTWVNGKPIQCNGRLILSGTGEISLTSPDLRDAAIIEFNYAGVESQETTPLVVSQGSQTFPQQTDDELIAAFCPTPPTANDANDSTDRGATQLREPARMAQNAADEPVQNETQMAPRQGIRALGYLQVRDKNGVKTIPITEFPFVIGREPEVPGYTVDHQASFVSRAHLTLQGFVYGKFKIENHGLGRNNTFRKGTIQDRNFYYRPVDANSDNGWLVLGGRYADERCVEVRLLTDRPEIAQ